MLYGRSDILKPTGLGSRSRLEPGGRERPEREDLVVENKLKPAAEETDAERRFDSVTANRSSVYHDERFLDSYPDFIPEGKAMEVGKRYVGLDLAKRTMEVCIVQDGEAGVKRESGMKTGGKGRERLAGLLRESDVVGMEACGYAFLLARYLQAETGCAVYMYILNLGKLRRIGQSTKKTSKEDALKIAKFIQRYPKEELPLVSLPTEQEEELRQLIAMKQFQVKTRTALINRLHALYVLAGETGLKKKDLAAAESREKQKVLLRNDTQRMIAESIERELEVVETELAAYKETIAKLVRGSELAPYIMSIPGVGPALAAAFIAYIGEGSRFETAGQVANYAGLTPVLDCSGDTQRYGHIQRGGCRALRSIILQSAWSLSRSTGGGRLKEKFMALSGRMNKTKSAVAIARRMVVLMWVLAKRRQTYAGISGNELAKKFCYYKLAGWESWLQAS
jgi:transposase